MKRGRKKKDESEDAEEEFTLAPKRRKKADSPVLELDGEEAQEFFADGEKKSREKVMLRTQLCFRTCD
jgi:hypothetical protein